MTWKTGTKNFHEISTEVHVFIINLSSWLTLFRGLTVFSIMSIGYYAWRNRDRGSWYVEALVQVFMKYAKCEDLCTMLNRVSFEIGE